MSKYDDAAAKLFGDAEPVASAAPTPAPVVNKYDEAANTVFKDDSSALRTAGFAAADADPMKAAKAGNLSRKTGIPQDIVLRNLPHVARQWSVDELDRMTANSPVLRKEFEDTYFAQIGQHDVPQLTMVEKGVRAFVNGGALKNKVTLANLAQWDKTYIGANLKGGTYDTLGVAATMLNQLGSALGLETTESEAAALFKNDPGALLRFKNDSAAGLLPRFARAMSAAGEHAREGMSKEAKDAYGGLTYSATEASKSALLSPVKIIGDVATQIPQLAALFVTARGGLSAAKGAYTESLAAGGSAFEAQAAAVAAASKQMALTGAATEGGVGYAQQYNQVMQEVSALSEAAMDAAPLYRQLLANGYTPDAARQRVAAHTAEQAAIVAGYVDAFVGKIGGELLGKVIGEGGKLLARFGKGFANESIVEGVQSGGEQLGQNLAEQKNIDPNVSLMKDVVENIIQGLAVGGVMGGSIAGALGRHHDQTQAIVNAESMKNVFGLAMGSKVRELDADTFAGFVDQASNGKTVHVDASILSETLQQSGIDMATFAQMSPTAAAALPDAMQMGGSVEIPVGDLLGKMGDSKLETALLPHLRADEDALSLEEAKAEQAAAQTLMQTRMQGIVQQATEGQAIEESGDKVKAIMLDQLRAVGRHSEDVNQVNATLVKAFYTIAGHMDGLTPEQAYAKNPLRVQGSATTEVDAEVLNQARRLPEKHRDQMANMYVAAAKRVVAAADTTGDLFQSGVGEQRRMRQTVDLAVLQREPSDALAQNVGTPGAKPGELSLTGVHFSKQPRAFLNGQYYGSGYKGAERERVRTGTDSRLAQRTYFYVDEGSGVRPEAGVGGAAHEARLTNIYDINADPLKLIVGGDINATESNILNAGFDGYYVSKAFNQQGAAVIIGEASRAIPVTPISHTATAAPALPQPPAVYKRGLLSSELKTIDIAAIKSVAPSADLKSGAFQVLESEFAAAAKVAAQQGIVLPASGYGQDGGVLGKYNPKTMTITMLEGANMSTFGHELAHHMLEVFMRIAMQADAPVQLRQDMEHLLAWGGVKDFAQWAKMTTSEKIDLHEKFAETFEHYLFTGKAPSRELQPLFQRFRGWMMRVYQSLRQFMQSHNTDLNPEVVAIFDRMLATDDQIAQVQEDYLYQQMFAAKPDGMTDEEFLANQVATGEAIDELQARSLRDLKWVLNARSKELTKISKDVSEKRKVVEAEVRAEVEKMPVYAVQRWLKTGVLPDGTKTEGAKLNTDALRDIQGDGPAALWRYLTTNMISNDKLRSLHPDVVAEMPGFDFSSGDQMVREIVGAFPEEQTVQGLTDSRVLERHGDIASPKAMQDAANEAVHNEYRAKALATEFAAMTQARQPVRVLVAAAKNFARQIVGRKLLKNLKPYEHERAEARAAKRAASAADLQEKMIAKRDQMLQFHAANETRKALEEAKSAKGLFLKIVSQADDKVGKTRNMDIVYATRAILAAYGFGAKAKKAGEYMKTVEAYDPVAFETLNDRILAAEADGKPFNTLTVDELRALRDEVESFWNQAKRVHQVEVDGKMVALKDAQQALVDSMEDKGVPDVVPGEGHAVTPGEARMYKFQTMVAGATRMENWIELMDRAPQGSWRRYIFNSIKDAADAYRAAKGQYLKRFDGLLREIAPSLKKGLIDAPELGYVFGHDEGGVGMGELLHALLHTGNESNKRKMLLGRKWATENEDGTLDTSRWDSFVDRMVAEQRLTKAHYDFAQKIWDMLDSMKPLAQKMHRDVFGRSFDEVTAQAFDTPFGSYRGGYVPALADPRIAANAREFDLIEKENKAMQFVFPHTNKGFTKARVDSNRPLMLNLATLGQHIDKVLLFSHMEAPVRDAARILKGKGVSYALNRIAPAASGSLIMPWLNRSAQQIVETPVPGSEGASAFYNGLRTRAGMATMFANLSNAVQQTTGLLTAFVSVPPAHMIKAMAMHVAHPSDLPKTVAASSTFMNNRMENEITHMQGAINQILLDPSVYQNAKAWTNRHAYFLQSAVDNVVGPIVWTAAHNDALERGMDDVEARRHADSVIRTTQGSSLPEDIAKYEAGTAFQKLFTQFTGYFNAQANLIGVKMANNFAELGFRRGAGRAMYITLFGVLAPMWVAEAISQAFKGGPEDKDKDGHVWDDWLAAVFGWGTVRTLAAAVPGVGQAVSAAVGAFTKQSYDDRVLSSPAIGLVENALRSGVDVYQAIHGEIKKQKLVKDLSTLMSLLTGLPAQALARPVSYLAGTAAGEIKPTSPLDAARGVVTGVASPASKQ